MLWLHCSLARAGQLTLSPTPVSLFFVSKSEYSHHVCESFAFLTVSTAGRNGVQPTAQLAWGDWCNVIGTGFGVRPTTNTGDPLEDAFVWVKPGGEADGSSNSSAPRYDFHCGLADALQPAPQAGTWFEVCHFTFGGPFKADMENNCLS